MPPGNPPRPPATPVCSREGPDGDVTLRLSGALTFEHAGALWNALAAEVSQLSGGKVTLELSAVSPVDGSAVAVLLELRRTLAERGMAVAVTGASPEMRDLLELYRGDDAHPRPDPGARMRGLAWLGRLTVAVLEEIRAAMEFIGSIAVAIGRLVSRPRSANWREVPHIAEKVGANALPIIFAVNFLIGIVTAFESATQLRRFGATIYTADLVGLSIPRELAPLITAIIVTGRSGAAFSAELASMKVSDEVDALRVMGADPQRFLVVPRVAALLLMLPMLVVLADAFGILGGIAVAIMKLDMTMTGFVIEMQTIVRPSDVVWGLAKSVAFALAIGLVACQQGLRASGGPSGVGKRTTSAVVSILFALIVIDAIFTVFIRPPRP